MSQQKTIIVLGKKPESEQQIVRYLKGKLENGLSISEINYLGFEERTHNYFFRFGENSHKNRKILVKLSRQAKEQSDYLPGHGDSPHEIYRTLTYLNRVIPENSKLAIPTPYMEFTEYNGFAREWVEGDCLVNLMHLGGRSASENSRLILKAHFRDVGETIGAFHFSTYDPNRCISENSVQRYLDNLSCFFYTNRYNLYQPIVSSAMAFLKRAKSEICWNQVGSSWVHGDLIPLNIILTREGKVSFIDYEHARFESPLFDASWFVVRTMLDSGWKVHKFSSTYLSKLSKSFLEGYIKSFKIEFDDKLFMFYSILNTLQCLYVAYNTSLGVFLRNIYAAVLLRNYLRTCKQRNY